MVVALGVGIAGFVPFEGHVAPSEGHAVSFEGHAVPPGAVVGPEY